LAVVLKRLVTDRYISNIGHCLLLLTRPPGKKWSWIRHYFLPAQAFLLYRYGPEAAAQPWWTRMKRSIHLLWHAHLLVRQMLVVLARRA
jgi:hypothetical protein